MTDPTIVTRTSRAEVTAENKRTRGDAVFSCRIIIERASNFL